MPYRFAYFTLLGFAIFIGLGPRLHEHPAGARWGLQSTAGSLFVYLGPFHVVLDRS